MKETGKVFGVLQRVGRAFMLPIAVLPVAGLLLGIGRSLTNETMLRAYHLMKIMGPGTVLYGVIKVGSDCGSIIFGNLPLIFAMGVSIGMAKAEKAVAALSGALSFFVMHEAISSMLSLYGDTYTMHAGATDQILGARRASGLKRLMRANATSMPRGSEPKSVRAKIWKLTRNPLPSMPVMVRRSTRAPLKRQGTVAQTAAVPQKISRSKP